MTDCLFCHIVRGDAPARIVHQDEDVTAFHDVNPQAPVHLLIIPNRHIAGVREVVAEDAQVLGRLFVVARRLAEDFDLSDGYRLVVNNGPAAGQSVQHLHVHLLGGRSLSWPPG